MADDELNTIAAEEEVGSEGCVAPRAQIAPRAFSRVHAAHRAPNLPPRSTLIQKNVTEPLYRFAQYSQAFLAGCHRPNIEGEPTARRRSLPARTQRSLRRSRAALPSLLLAEFYGITVATGVGFIAMGLISFFVKIINIPVTQVILGQS